jgi:molecular chaperone GrpE
VNDKAATNEQVVNVTVSDGEVAAEVTAAGPIDPRSQVERERDDYLDSLQRLQADFENYRKRVARSSEESAVRAAGGLVVKLLPVLDALDLAQAHFLGVANEEAAAIDQSRALLLDTLSKEGLERIDAVGVAFDPQVHDAVAHVPGDEGESEQIVLDVLRAGYRWKGAVLRPAMVRVKG